MLEVVDDGSKVGEHLLLVRTGHAAEHALLDRHECRPGMFEKGPAGSRQVSGARATDGDVLRSLDQGSTL